MRLLAVMLAAMVTSACLGPSAAEPDPQGSDSGSGSGKADDPGDGSGSDGSGSAFLEAPHPTQPTVMSEGGNILVAPKVVPIFFQGDSGMQSEIESFLGQLVGSSYWTAITAEYGVGGLTIGSSVVSTDPPPTSDDALQTWIIAHAGVDWPANDPGTIYAVFLPAGITLTTPFGTSCVAFGGYHDEVTDGSIVYALLPRCDSTVDTLTLATSHELLEASTDPHPFTAPAFNVVDDDDVMWEVTPGGELGDMCEYADGVRQRLVGNFLVQRTWSNQSAAAGHDPCVPALQTPYVEASPNLTEAAVDFGGGQVITTRTVSVPLGTSTVVDVDLYSDAPAADWTVTAYDVASAYTGSSPELSLALDRTTGHNGDTLHLTVTRLATGSQFSGDSEIEVVSMVNGVTIGTWWALATP